MSCPSFPGCASPPVELPGIVGTAPVEEAYCILELAKPWPPKIKKVEGLVQDLRSVLKSHKSEEVCLLAAPQLPWTSEIERPRLVLLRWNGETTVVQELPADPNALRSALISPPEGTPRDIYLVCTHGSRDPCCGLLGVPVYKRLAEISKRQVIQTSHLGGHRFAPVVAAFPEWRFYGHVGLDQLEELDRALSERLPYLKGYRGFGRVKPELQLFEAAVWQERECKIESLRKLEQQGNRLTVEVQAGTECLIYRGEIEYWSYRGYKDCKDFRKDKQSTLELPLLKRLERLSSHPVGRLNPGDGSHP